MRPIRIRISRQFLTFDKNTVLKLYFVGIPATLNLALPSVLISALNSILSLYSEVYILVLGIYYKLQTFLYLPANGIIQGMVVNPQHYRRLTLKQTMDAENVLLEQGKVIDFPLKPSDLSRYDEVLYD